MEYQEAGKEVCRMVSVLTPPQTSSRVHSSTNNLVVASAQSDVRISTLHLRSPGGLTRSRLFLCPQIFYMVGRFRHLRVAALRSGSTNLFRSITSGLVPAGGCSKQSNAESIMSNQDSKNHTQNPLICDHPGDTLHGAACAISFIQESLTTRIGKDPEHLSDSATSGLYWLLQCVTDAISHEAEVAGPREKKS